MTTSPSNSTDILVPLAEHFHSVQGEGHFVGTAMHFLRFPGCTVGKEQERRPFTKDEDPNPFKFLPNQSLAKVCTSYNGDYFFCDTDYAKHEEKFLQDLLSETWEPVICLTGGEPLMHQKQLWFKELVVRSQCELHVETSGTIQPLYAYDWLTVSPKKGWLTDVVGKADQVKLLVTRDTILPDLDAIVEWTSSECLVYLSPVFDPNELVRANLERCLELQQQRPEWRLGVQWHKFIGIR